MKKILFVFAAILGLSLLSGSEAFAYTSVFDQGHSSATHKGVTITTGTVVQVDVGRADELDGYRHAGIRVGNDSSFSIYCGYNSSVAPSGVNKGAFIPAGGSSVFTIDVNVPLYCVAADAAGASGIEASIEFFGFS